MLKSKILNNELTIGSWVTLGSTAVAEILARAGFDWLVVDLEHSTISIDQAGELVRTISLSGVSPLVRLTSNDVNQIKRVMDAGAHGIVVPMVNTAADAIKAVRATRYAPLGSRGVGLARAQGYGNKFQEYLEWQSGTEEGPIVIVQIEHIDAVSNLKEILSVPAVDAFIVGPYDLSCSMGIPGQFEKPEFIETLELINSIAKEMHVSAGLHVVEPDTRELNIAIDKGYTFVAYSVDIRMIDVAARSGLSACNGEDL
jgi:2-keto-3-deoxy-L-rhamnonate aldolase RhmA